MRLRPQIGYLASGNGSFVGVEVSWRENGAIVRIAVLLVGTGMAPFVSRDRREKGCLFVFYAEHNNKIEGGLSGT